MCPSQRRTAEQSPRPTSPSRAAHLLRAWAALLCALSSPAALPALELPSEAIPGVACYTQDWLQSGNLSEMQALRLYPRPAESEPLDVWGSVLCSERPLPDSDAY